MKRFLTFGLLVVAATTTARADLPSQPVMGALTGAAGCQHVLDLLMRYGPLEGRPTILRDRVVPSPYGAFVMPAAEFGDLCLTNLTEVPQADASCLPVFVVAVTNNSTRPVCDVSISLVAMLGPIRPCDPTATVKLSEIPAGATVEVDITLPVEALAMGNNGGSVVGFQKVLVAIDSLDTYVETNESNNLHLVCRSDIPQQVIAAAAPSEPAASSMPVAPEAGAEGGPAQLDPSGLDSALESFGIDQENSEAVAERL